MCHASALKAPESTTYRSTISCNQGYKPFWNIVFFFFCQFLCAERLKLSQTGLYEDSQFFEVLTNSKYNLN